jgi:TPR repeat protein
MPERSAQSCCAAAIKQATAPFCQSLTRRGRFATPIPVQNKPKAYLAFVLKHRTVAIMDTSWFRHFFNRSQSASLANTQSKAEQGDAEAQFSLGLKFATGSATMQDYPKAALWYLKAASQNHPLAQFNLGLMFAGGQGVAQDEAQAMMWMRLAAQQGDAGAQYHLGMRHRRASFEGHPEDALESNLEAYKWFRLAAAQGYKESESARDDILIGFTLAQVEEGNHRAASCMSAPLVHTQIHA